MSAPHIVILAAGQGKRMVSSLPKVLHEVLFRPMIHYVIEVAREVGYDTLSVVIGHGADQVRDACSPYPDIRFIEQNQQLGTGHAVRMMEPHLKDADSNLIVLSGDVILMRPESLTRMLERHTGEGASATVATAILENPWGYGRILRNDDGSFSGIREQADCSADENKVSEVNSGLYCFRTKDLFAALARIGNENKQGEYYLPDVLKLMLSDGKRVSVTRLANPLEMSGINDRHALWEAQKVMQERVNRGLMFKGVTLRDPLSTFIDSRCKFESDVTIEGNCTLINSRFGSGVRIESQSRILNSKIASRSHIKQGSYIEESEVGELCQVGPYAHLRPGTRLGKFVKIGNFVEVKNSSFDEGAKASHLSYIGDASIGKSVNLGCGFITCNYDGVKKHKTVIEDKVFVGSDSQTVAPVTIGAGSYVASGSTVTDDVPAGSLVITRGRQTTKPGYAKKYSPKG